MSARGSQRRRFARRMGLLAATWIVVLLVARRVEGDGAFGALVVVLVWALPLAAPLIAWLDWRWLGKQEEGA